MDLGSLPGAALAAVNGYLHNRIAPPLTRPSDHLGPMSGIARMTLKTLKNRADFLRVRRGRKFATPSLVLQANVFQDAKCGNDGSADKVPRVGFTVTKRIGSAVKRNLVRRRLKEAVRLIGPLHAQPGYDYVLIGRQGTLKRGFADILEDLRRAFHRIHCSASTPRTPQ